LAEKYPIRFFQTAAQASPRNRGKTGGENEAQAEKQMGNFCRNFSNAAVIFQFVALHLL